MTFDMNSRLSQLIDEEKTEEEPKEPEEELEEEEAPEEEEAAEDEEKDSEEDDLGLSIEEISKQFEVSEDEILDNLGLEINGEFASMKEMKDGYLRHKDYTQKTQKLSEELSRITPFADLIGVIEADEGLQGVIHNYLSDRNSVLLEDDISDDKLRELFREDPDEAEKALSRREKKAARQAKVNQAQKRQHELLMNWVNNEEAIAKRKIPQYYEEKSQINEFLKKYGFKDNEIDKNVYLFDSRVQEIILDAYNGKSNSQQDSATRPAVKRKKAPRLIGRGASTPKAVTPRRKQEKLRQQAFQGNDSATRAYLMERHLKDE